MEKFIYDAPTKVYFGRDTHLEIGKILKQYNPQRVLVHYGQSSVIKSGLLDQIANKLKEENIDYILFGGVKANPELSLVREGIALAKSNNIDFILAIGGGSVLDSAKDIANGLANPDIDVWDFCIGKASPKATIRKGCILTIAAAGSEMSNSCVITNADTKEKRGYGSPFNHFDFTIENPELTYTVSKYQTACGISDIAMHTIERYFDLGKETELTDDLSIAIIKNTYKYGLIALNNPNDYNARSQLMWASSLTHNGLTGCGKEFLLTVHQLEHELSGLYPSIAHGAGLAALWCSWARYTYKSCLERFKNYFISLFDIDVSNKTDEQIVIEGINKQEQYYKQIGMPTSLKELDVKESDLEYLANCCSRNKTRTIKGYHPLSYEDILAIYKMAYPKR